MQIPEMWRWTRHFCSTGTRKIKFEEIRDEEESTVSEATSKRPREAIHI